MDLVVCYTLFRPVTVVSGSWGLTGRWTASQDSALIQVLNGSYFCTVKGCMPEGCLLFRWSCAWHVYKICLFITFLVEPWLENHKLFCETWFKVRESVQILTHCWLWEGLHIVRSEKQLLVVNSIGIIGQTYRSLFKSLPTGEKNVGGITMPFDKEKNFPSVPSKCLVSKEMYTVNVFRVPSCCCICWFFCATSYCLCLFNKCVFFFAF